ncbi:hypothetical protein Cni_G14225 [Canna indica]|uniref:DNA polymerase delta subunit 4 n=1 Tax=Canna indica TaxID=4628 RepID=A0AAQ3QAG9_9LILI|nr:hypothetical protein Cni_G14225 [Canna indica]
MASGGIKSFYRQQKRGGGVAKPSSTKRGKSASAAALSLTVSDPDQFPIHGSDDGKAASVASAFKEEEAQLRLFDMDMRYGPCVGLSRMERWDRAAAMGLNPPAEVEAILAKSSAASAECLWGGRI